MRWRFRHYAKLGTRLATILTILGAAHPAGAEDQQSGCVAAAEHAQALRLEHKLLESRNELLVCAQSVCPTVISTDCVRWLSEVEAALPSVVFKATGPYEQDIIAVSVWIDGAKVLDGLDGLARPVDPGVHRFRFESAGMVPVEEQVLIREGEARRILPIRFTGVPPAPATLAIAGQDQRSMARAIPVLPMVFAGVGLAALGSFAYFGITGREEASDLASGCGRTKSCAQSQVDPVRTKLIVADVSLGVSLISLGIATYLLVTQQRVKPRENSSIQIDLRPSLASVHVGVNF